MNRSYDVILFLDFDGVIVPTQYVYDMFKAGKGEDLYDWSSGASFSQDHVNLLNPITSRPTVGVVVISSWRALEGKSGRETFPVLFERNRLTANYLGTVGRITNNRSEEIRTWIMEHGTEGTKYIILDDAPMTLRDIDCLVVSPAHLIGLTKEHVEEITKYIDVT